jgi:ribokinase
VKIAVVGSYGVGMTMRLPRVPVAGETLSGGEFASGHGGKGSNQAVAAARLGAQVSLLTAVGDDAMGHGARELWAAEGVDASDVIAADGAPTMVGMILVEPSGENRIVIANGALDRLLPEHVGGFAQRLAEADVAVVCLEIPVATAARALEAAHGAGARTLLNPAPATPLPPEIWRHVDVVTPNRTEAAILLGLEPDTDVATQDLAIALRTLGAATVVVTLGAEGALVHDDRGTRRVPPVAPRGAVVDTTGAGDAFTGALAVALARGEDVDAAVRFAARAGAHAVTIAEVIPALPYLHDLEPGPGPGPGPGADPAAAPA